MSYEKHLEEHVEAITKELEKSHEKEDTLKSSIVSIRNKFKEDIRNHDTAMVNLICILDDIEQDKNIDVKRIYERLKLLLILDKNGKERYEDIIAAGRLPD